MLSVKMIFFLRTLKIYKIVVCCAENHCAAEYNISFDAAISDEEFAGSGLLILLSSYGVYFLEVSNFRA